MVIPFERSFASYENKERVEQWHPTLNGDVTPRDVYKSSHTKRWFKCSECGHNFDIILYSIISGGWCSYCSHQKICLEDCDFCFQLSFASYEDEEILNQWHPTRNGDLTPRQVFKATGKKFWFTCVVCGHSFDITLSNVVTGHWCCYCCIPHRNMCLEECDFCFQISFASYDKEKVEQWCLILNKGITPRQVAKYSNKKWWFKCKECTHSFDIALHNVIAGHWCCYCCIPHRNMCLEECDFCFQISFASYEDKDKVKQWHPTKNGSLTPRQVFKHSNKKIWFLCQKCGHEFNPELNNVTNGHWCSVCAKRGYSKICIEWLKTLPNYDLIQHAETEGGEHKLFKKSRHLADGYDKTTNTVYEYHGCKFHGCPKCFPNRNDLNYHKTKTYEQLYQATLKKEQMIKDHGYNLVVIWGCEFHTL